MEYGSRLEEIKARARTVGPDSAVTPRTWANLMRLATEDVPLLISVIEAMDDLRYEYQGIRSEAELMAIDVGRVLQRLE